MPNTEDNFWNDERVIEFMNYFKNDFSKGFPKLKAMEYFKNSNQSKQPVLDYEILSIAQNGTTNWSCNKNTFDYYLKNGWRINQVKRLSDNEVFTIGDTIESNGNKYEIHSFQLNRPSVPQSVTVHAGGKMWHLDYITKTKTPIYHEELIEVKLTESELYKLMQLINGIFNNYKEEV